MRLRFAWLRQGCAVGSVSRSAVARCSYATFVANGPISRMCGMARLRVEAMPCCLLHVVRCMWHNRTLSSGAADAAVAATSNRSAPCSSTPFRRCWTELTRCASPSHATVHGCSAGRNLPALRSHGTGARPCHICAGTGLLGIDADSWRPPQLGGRGGPARGGAQAVGVAEGNGTSCGTHARARACTRACRRLARAPPTSHWHRPTTPGSARCGAGQGCVASKSRLTSGRG